MHFAATVLAQLLIIESPSGYTGGYTGGRLHNFYRLKYILFYCM